MHVIQYAIVDSDTEDSGFFIGVEGVIFETENPQNYSISMIERGLIGSRKGLLIELQHDTLDVNAQEWLLGDVPDDVAELIEIQGSVLIDDVTNNKQLKIELNKDVINAL